ncbi:hypothetical protein [Parerythrobacter lacustris]|uniref:Uncharacterized protein n=1 Tax=Parerythrobacter lacustris TaxID=2969984 RepID=A0ABT1XRV2_9SPHN|nr:hypothetical protein [Parerythrobacter lacustris]MCR2834381.1 hypothetical protein [Parerythrobacter lacustris]
MTKARTTRAPSGHRARRWIWPLAVVGLLLAGGVWAYGGSIKGNAEAGTAYMARVACSCRFVAGRSLEDCARDKLDGMALITLVDDEEAKSVTARFPLVAANKASYRKGYGCVLETWED